MSGRSVRRGLREALRLLAVVDRVVSDELWLRLEPGNIGTAITEQTNTVVAFKNEAKREAATRQFLSFWLMDYSSAP
jgi:hypothetical protein